MNDGIRPAFSRTLLDLGAVVRALDLAAAIDRAERGRFGAIAMGA